MPSLPRPDFLSWRFTVLPPASGSAPNNSLVDRFGSLPDEVRHLLEVVAIKQLALAAGVEKIDAGPKGGIVAFRNNAFANPLALIQFIGKHAGTMKVRPDQKIVVSRDWPTPDHRLEGAKALLAQLAKLAQTG